MTSAILGLVAGVVTVSCPVCGERSEAVEIRGPRDSRWQQYARCPRRTTTRGPGVPALSDLVDAEHYVGPLVSR